MTGFTFGVIVGGVILFVLACFYAKRNLNTLNSAEKAIRKGTADSKSWISRTYERIRSQIKS